MKILEIYLVCILCLWVVSSCNTPSEGNSHVNAPGNTRALHQDFSTKGNHLNISVLIDLSNRINPQKNKLNPSQIDRDKAIIKVFCEALKNNVSDNGSFSAKARMRVFFHPQPANDTIAQTAQMLTAIFKSGTSTESVKENKKLYSTIDSNFESGLNSLYSFALKDRQFPGSNIWRFMKEDVRNQCIENSPDFRNILVILSDGYMYYKNEVARESNRYTYIERPFDHFRRFRNLDLFKEEFDQKNYGFITSNSQLDNLEVILMEVSPEVEYPQDFDIISKYWSKWFTEMGVRRFKICKTDLPVNTVTLVNNFLKDK